MVGRGLRRIVGGISVFAMAAGFAATVGVGSAAAVEWDSGGRYFTRTVSNENPTAGETITSKTVFQRSSLEYLYAMKDVHPTCWTYVPGSAKVNGSARAPESVGADFVRIEGSITQWPVYSRNGLINPRSWTLEVSYVVGADCARDVPLMTTAHMSGSSGADGTYQNKGPTVTVAKDATTTVLAPVPTSVLTGQSVTLTATVTGAAQGSPVEFYDGATKLGEGALDASGVGTFAWTPSTAGARSLTAKYLGTAIANSSQSAPQNVQVDAPVDTTVSVAAPGTAETGTPVTLSADVLPANAVGTVQFKDNGTAIGSPVAVASGAASLQHTFGAAGSHSITAEFLGGAGFAASTSAAVPVTVSDPDVVTSLELDAPASAQTGTPVALSATVTPPGAQGVVQFKIGGVEVGAPVPVANDSASLSHTFNAAGSFEVTAEFTGAAGFTDSSASAQNVTVSDPEAETSLSVQVPGSATTGVEVDLVAELTPQNASGTVQFTDNGAPIGAPVSVVNGVATLPHTFTSTGAHSIGAAFTGAPGFADASSSPGSITVSDPDQQTTTTVSVPATAQTGLPVNLEATVYPETSGGTVQFQVDGADIGSPVPVSGGAAGLSWTFGAAGSFEVTAVYSGTTGFEGSTSDPQSMIVSDPDVTTSLTVSESVPTSAATGDSVDLTATVDPSSAQGEIQFSVNGSPVGAAVPVSAGSASLPYVFSVAGVYAVTAEFTGAAGFTNSTAPARNVTVTDPVVPDTETTTTVTAPVTGETGQQITLSAAVSPVPSAGTVQFTVAGVDVGAPVSVDGNGHASMPYTFGSAGSYAVSASYSGAPGFAGSTATAHTVTVTDPVVPDVATETTVGVPATATTGVETTLSVSVQAQSGEAAPTGSVQFLENGSPISVSMSLVNGSASLAHTFSAVGTRQISAVYTADAGFLGSTSAERSVVVSAPDPSDVESSVEITSTQAPTVGAPYVLKAQVTGAESLPGTVQFFDGGVEIGAPVPVVDGFAELTHTFMESGPRQIHAVYSGGAGVAGSTSDEIVLDVIDSDGGDTGGIGSLDFGSLGSLSGLRFDS